MVSNLTFSFEAQKTFDRVYFLETSIISKVVVCNLVVLYLKRNLKGSHMGYLIDPMGFIFENVHYYYKNGQNTRSGGNNRGQWKSTGLG